jgi:hypothetical protein
LKDHQSLSSRLFGGIGRRCCDRDSSCTCKLQLWTLLLGSNAALFKRPKGDAWLLGASGHCPGRKRSGAHPKTEYRRAGFLFLTATPCQIAVNQPKPNQTKTHGLWGCKIDGLHLGPRHFDVLWESKKLR